MTSIKAPVAKREDHFLEMHGHKRNDPYFWMRGKEKQEVVDHLTAENDYTKACMSHTEDFQKGLFEELKGRIQETDESVPYFRNKYWYYTRFEEGKSYPIHCRKAGAMTADEEVLLDVNVLAEGHDYYKVVQMSVSEENDILAYAVDTKGNWVTTVYFLDLKTGELLEDKLENIAGFTWASDNKTVFYACYDAALRPHEVARHLLGDDNSKDEVVYREPDVTYRAFAYKTTDRKLVLFGSASQTTSEYSFVDAYAPSAPLRLVQQRREGHEYSLDHHEFFHTDE